MRHKAAQAFHARLPQMSVDVFEQVIKYALPLIIGSWPLSNPVDVAAQVIALPELEGLRYDF
ncbi:hypothetical protein [Xanthomonas hortorum]|uniref:hypothetical protein n=1 Tax=Xanthomonas hortorum TaxID=56454 RepID=UPI001C3D2403|nr:hypothetical protein [Xanthomonas hortorum]